MPPSTVPKGRVGDTVAKKGDRLFSSMHPDTLNT
jgi:hypothetical protein